MLRQLFFYTLVMVVLNGCTSNAQQMGVSEAAWQAMTAKQRAQMQSGYAQIKQFFYDADRNSVIYDAPPISVLLIKGTAMMPPFNQPYPLQSAYITLSPGPCRQLELKSSDHSHQVDMRLCYNGLRLAIDPSHYEVSKRQGTVYFYYTPLWTNGFTYTAVNTSGYVRLHGVDINIKAVT
jgi:hypothetical protein